MFKTHVNNFNFAVASTGTVDGETWRTIKCFDEVAEWIREQPGSDIEWVELTPGLQFPKANIFDVNERIYFMLALRWGS